MRFALNHSIAPLLPIADFLDLASEVGVDAVELRDGMPPGWEFPDTTNVLMLDPVHLRDMVADAGLEILSINALQRFDQWDRERHEQARAMIEFAARAGIGAIVLCPSVAPAGSPALPTELATALDALQPMLVDSGVKGLIEPLGFPSSSIRFKGVVDAELAARGNPACLGIVHDSFHHAIAQDPTVSAATLLVHLSGVTTTGLGLDQLGDRHRVLIDEHDTIANLEQVRQLSEGYDGPWSLEPFASSVGSSATLADDLRASLAFIAAGSGSANAVTLPE
jgi:2-keto-myo-inositol isomerase